ncbi:hypothetical protein L226DRAFT_259703 [Lentinus tigrinus ALCF2SS1-7]|uniref:uncharacterized protein n=1 Tax=Lentinus tigrinus ALCF2SS1-7 TaxID=1328758 RepID=UPI0011662732|nr:hypothetical protein L226DRAFT_259703 [Lentinus tigrinus ALCF2SS1-7]
MRLQSQNEIIQIAQADVWEYLGITSATRGSLYIRSEYKSMYERLCNSHKWLDPLDIDPPYIPGVIVTGQPGIGKSYFSVYALLQRMADEQPVVFFTRRGWAVYVDDSGIRRTSISSIDAPVDFPLVSYAPPASRIWALIDAPVAKGPIPDAIIASSMFYVLCASPERSTYTHLLKQSAREFYMDPWTDQELFAMFTLTARPSDHRPSLEWVRDMRSEFGPCPRDLVLAARDRERVKRDITRAITSSSMKLLFNLPEDATTPLDVASDELILRVDLRRSEGQVLEGARGAGCGATLPALQVRTYSDDGARPHRLRGPGSQAALHHPYFWTGPLPWLRAYVPHHYPVQEVSPSLRIPEPFPRLHSSS